MGDEPERELDADAASAALSKFVNARFPRCVDCHHMMNGVGGLCIYGWCRCVCRSAAERDAGATR